MVLPGAQFTQDTVFFDLFPEQPDSFFDISLDCNRNRHIPPVKKKNAGTPGSVVLCPTLHFLGSYHANTMPDWMP